MGGISVGGWVLLFNVGLNGNTYLLTLDGTYQLYEPGEFWYLPARGRGGEILYVTAESFLNPNGLYVEGNRIVVWKDGGATQKWVLPLNGTPVCSSTMCSLSFRLGTMILDINGDGDDEIITGITDYGAGRFYLSAFGDTDEDGNGEVISWEDMSAILSFPSSFQLSGGSILFVEVNSSGGISETKGCIVYVDFSGGVVFACVPQGREPTWIPPRGDFWNTGEIMMKLLIRHPMK